MREDSIHYGPTHTISLRQELMSKLEQGYYTPEQMREMLLTTVSSCSHYWDLDQLVRAAERVDPDPQSHTVT